MAQPIGELPPPMYSGLADEHRTIEGSVSEMEGRNIIVPFGTVPIYHPPKVKRFDFKAWRMKHATNTLWRPYTWCSVFASVGGFIFGFDTGSIGPVTVMSQFKEKFNSSNDATLQGLIVSSILITASMSSLAAGPLSDRISRTRTFALGGLIFGIGSVLASAAQNLPMLFVGRCITGLGEGLFLSTITVYILEIAPTSLRGRLSCLIQLFVTIGVAAGYFISFGSVRLTSSISWRLLFICQAVVSFIFFSGSLFLPHSPRWLQHVGRTEDAARAWAKLGYSAAEAEKEQEVEERERHEIAVETEQAQRQSDEAAEGPRRDRFKGTVWGKDVRRRTLLGMFLMAMQQACGIDGVLYYAPVLFSQAGLSSNTAAFLASGVSGLINVACTIITQIFTDKWGRRTSTIRGGLAISGTMLTIGALYASGASETPAGKWAIIALIYIFVVAFAMSWAVVNRIYCSEIQPMHTRAAASSLGQCANWVVNWVIAFSTPLFLAHSSSGPYFLFGACSFLTVIVCALFQPESKGVSLESLDRIFEVSPWRKLLAKSASRIQALRGLKHARRGSDAVGEEGSNGIEAVELRPISVGA